MPTTKTPGEIVSVLVECYPCFTRVNCQQFIDLRPLKQAQDDVSKDVEEGRTFDLLRVAQVDQLATCGRHEWQVVVDGQGAQAPKEICPEIRDFTYSVL